MEAGTLTLPQMIDVALTTPEVGIVDHRLLANILKVMCKKLNLQDVMIPYEGVLAAQMLDISNIGNKQTVSPKGSLDKPFAMVGSAEIETIKNLIDKMQKDIENLRGGRVPHGNLDAEKVEHTHVSHVAGTGKMASLDAEGNEQNTGFKSAILADMTSQEAMDFLYKEMKNMRSLTDDLNYRVETLTESDAMRKSTEQEEEMREISNKLAELELKITECIVQINKMDTIFSSSYNDMMNNLTDVENTVKILSDKALKDAGKADIEEHLLETVQTVNHKLTTIEASSTKLSDAVALLLEENTIKNTKFMNLMEEIDHLQADKIGREEFAESLSEKVDLCMINRKVSNDQFNATCDDLSRGIEEALEKLVAQEDLWHIAVKEIQQEINQKLCKEDLIPLQDLMTQKLKELHRRMKVLSIMREEREAAVSKKYFIKDVIMKKKADESYYPGVADLIVKKGKAPQISYELDDLRKQQQQSPYGRKMNIFQEAAVYRPRYCGGAHTITTPQQRTSKLSSFSDGAEKPAEKSRLSGSLTGVKLDKAEKDAKSTEVLIEDIKKTSRISFGAIMEKIEPAERDETGVNEDNPLEETLKTSKLSVNTSLPRLRSKDEVKGEENQQVERKRSSRLSATISAQKIPSTEKDPTVKDDLEKTLSKKSLVKSTEELGPDHTEEEDKSLESKMKGQPRSSLNAADRLMADETKNIRKSLQDAIASLEKVHAKD